MCDGLEDSLENDLCYYDSERAYGSYIDDIARDALADRGSEPDFDEPYEDEFPWR